MNFHVRCLCHRPPGPRVSLSDARARKSAGTDPTGTLPLQRRFSRDLDARWRRLRATIQDAVVARTHPVNAISHAAITGDDPVRAFQSWMNEALRQIVMGGTGAWTLSYVRAAGDAAAVRHGQPQRDRVPQLQTLCVSELQGICDAVSQQTTRVLAHGILNGSPMSQIVNDVRRTIDDVGQRRGRMLVSFIVVRTFGAATLDALRARGVTRVGTIPEARRTPVLATDATFQSRKQTRAERKLQRKFGGAEVDVITAGDDRVCPQCEEISEEGPYTLDRAEGLIPAHPLCRCAFVAVEEVQDHIVRLPSGKYRLLSHEGKNLGTFATREEAARHEGEVEWFKAHDSATHVAAGTMITAESTGRTLFLRRASGDNVGTWAFPGGAVEPGETPHMAAARETHEEIGYDPTAEGLQQLDRRQINGVDFTTYAHDVDEEFRPHLNGEHDAYRWAHLENAPEPLHPGVIATLLSQSSDVSDEFDPDEPRDEHGMWTSGGSTSGGISSETEAKTLHKVMQSKGASVVHYLPNDKPDKNTHVFTAHDPDSSEKVKSVLESGGYKYETFKPSPSSITPAGSTGYRVKVSLLQEQATKTGAGFQQFSKKPDPLSPKELKKTHGENVFSAPPQEHPSKKYLSQVKGTMAERVQMRKDLKTATGDHKKELQHKIVASFWKQHSSSFGPKKEEVAANVAKYSKSYGIANPLKTAEVPAFGKAAPKPKSFEEQHGLPAHMFKENGGQELDFKSLTKVGDQKGSNPGGVFRAPDGAEYYVKTMDEAHARNELLAARLYALAGSKTLDYVPVKPDGATHYVATRMVTLDKNNVSQLTPVERQMAQRDFATHAWLANWDAAGTGGDNQGVHNGVVKTLDVGGSLAFRAKGTPKGDAFGTSVEEFNTLRDPTKNADAAKLFDGMTDEQLRKSASKVTTISSPQIRQTVYDVYGETPESKDLVTKLKARRDDLINRVNGLAKPKVEDLSSMTDEEQRMHWLRRTVGAEGDKYLAYHMGLNGDVSQKKREKLEAMGVTPAEVGFIRAFTGPSSSVNNNLRDGHMDEHEFAFKHIMNEALAKMPAFDGDRVYRKIQLTPAQQDKYAVGKIVHWQAFSSTSKNEGTWSGNTHFTIHNPRSGRDVQFISENPSEAEVIMPADTYYRVLSNVKDSYGNRKIGLEEVLPFGKASKQKKAA